MSGPIVRLFVQVFVAGVGVVSRAFVQAYQQAAANPNAAKAAAANAKRSLRKEMKLDEALKVLNFDSTPKNLPEVTERYEQYFNANDPKKGGSFYLQSKFHRAKEVVEKQLAEEAAAKAGKPAEKSDESNALSGPLARSVHRRPLMGVRRTSAVCPVLLSLEKRRRTTHKKTMFESTLYVYTDRQTHIHGCTRTQMGKGNTFVTLSSISSAFAKG